MFLLALAVLSTPADWVPARWFSSDPASLDLVKNTPVNCLLLEQADWKPAFITAARDQGVAVLGLVRAADLRDDLSERAAALKLTGVALEGEPDEKFMRLRSALADSGLAVVNITPRTRMEFGGDSPIVATWQGVWPGINPAEDGSAKAAPSGAPWIDTNAGFLRFAAALHKGEIWMGNTPPEGKMYPPARYIQALADAAICGARWILALDSSFQKALLARDAQALKGWQAVAAHLRYYEENKEWLRMPPYGHLALVQDKESGALLSGSILDMIAVKHTPVRPVPIRMLSDDRVAGSTMAVSVDPSALNPTQTEVLRRFTRGGGTLLTAPPGWKFPPQRDNQIVLDKEDVQKLDQIWKEVNSLTGRRNLGVRLFNVSSMLSTLYGASDGKRLVLHLVNYSDYPVENVTAIVLGKYAKATLHAPDAAPRPLDVYEAEEGVGFDIAKVNSIATLIIEN